MGKGFLEKSDCEKSYQVDKGWRASKAGAAIGMLLGAMTYMLFSRWLPEQFFGYLSLIGAAVFGVAFGFIWPIELSYREFDDDPDNITPAERVKRLNSVARNTTNDEQRHSERLRQVTMHHTARGDFPSSIGNQ